MASKNYYAVLNVLPSAEDTVIRSAYRALAQRYHPDKYDGDMKEAEHRMAELNQAYETLSDPAKRKEYDSSLQASSMDANTSAHGNDDSGFGNKIFNEFVHELNICLEHASISDADLPIRNEKISRFNCQVELAFPIISPNDARKLFLTDLSKAIKTLPRGETPDLVLRRFSPVWIPFWNLSASASAEWRANGIVIEKWEVNCPACQGRKTVGRGKKKHNCPQCRGRGTETRTKKKIIPERGNTVAEVEPHLVSNISLDIDFNLAPYDAIERCQLPESLRQKLVCLSPKSFDQESQTNMIGEKLVEEIHQNVKDTLSSYDRVDDIKINNDSVKMRSGKINAFLYPAYICWYKRGNKYKFLICDAATGEVSMPSPTIGFHIKKTIAFALKATTVMLILPLVLVGLLNSKDNVTPEQNTKVPNQAIVAPKKPTQPSPQNTSSQESAVSPLINNDQTTNGPSFNCAKASTNAEKLICSDHELAALDVEMQEAYNWLAGAISDKNALKKEQRDWIKNQRDICSTSECMAKAYRDRTNDLAAKAQYLVKPTEFK